MDKKRRDRSLITGATGFVGGSLAAALLKDGQSVVALSRQDTQGTKTRASIKQAARILGFTLPESVLERNLQVVSGSLEEANRVLTEDILRDVTGAWHLAATLSYNPRKLARSLAVNVASTAELYKLLSARAPNCRRFYYCSTAYSVGLPERDECVAESLHPAPRDPNAYQLSKWSAEMSLRALSLESTLPVTILRPSVVMGHSASGAYQGEPFGLYMFLRAGHRFITQSGIRELRLAPEINGAVNLIPIDVLVENWVRLARHEGPERRPFEVIHCTGAAVPAADLCRAAERVSNMRISFDGPRSVVDHLFDKAIAENRTFVARPFHFEERRLREILGPEFVEVHFSAPALEACVRSYFERLDREEPAPNARLWHAALVGLSHFHGTMAGGIARFLREQGRKRRALAAVS